MFGFAEAFGDRLFVSTGFGIPQTPTSAVYDHVFTSADGGQTWAAVPEFSFDITNSGFQIGRPAVADGVLYLPRATADGNVTPAVLTSTVLRTTDGISWVAAAAAGLDPRDGALVNVARQDGVLYGHAPQTAATNGVGYVYRSADEGATWARVGAERTPGLLTAAGARLLLTRDGTAAGERSADGGATWASHGTQLYTAARNTDGVTLAGALQTVQRSTDGGTTFAAIPQAAIGFGGTFSVGACGSVLFVTRFDTVVRSDDGGLTWARWGEGLPGGGTNVRAYSCSAGGPAARGGPTYVYAATTDGAVLYRRDVSQLPVAAEAMPAAGDLALSVGPNPAGRAAMLRLALAEAATVRVTVADALGRTVLALDRALAAGSHALPLDVSRLAPGVYVARVAAAGGGAGAASSVRFTIAR